MSKQITDENIETINTSNIYFGHLLQVKNGILTKSEIKFAVIEYKKYWFSTPKYITYPDLGDSEVYLPVKRKYDIYSVLIKPEEIFSLSFGTFTYPEKSKISMQSYHVITEDDENLSFLVDYTKLSNILGNREINSTELKFFVARNNDPEKLREFEESRRKESKKVTIQQILKETQERTRVSNKEEVKETIKPEKQVEKSAYEAEREEVLVISKELQNKRTSDEKIVNGIKKLVFTGFFAAIAVTVGTVGINLYKNNKDGKFSYEYDVDGNLLLTGNVKYDSVKDWYLVEKEMINGEHKLFITSSNCSEDLIDVLRDVKVGNKKALTNDTNQTNEFGIVNIRKLDEYLLAYDMVKPYYTSEDIKNVLTTIEENYKYESKVLQK